MTVKKKESKKDKKYPLHTPLEKVTKPTPSLELDEIYKTCRLKKFDAKISKSNLHYDIISQPRAIRAIRMGLGIEKPGYNIYVAGEQGTGKTNVIKTFLKKSSLKRSPPNDWIFVYNFKNSESPCAISVATGQAKIFKKDMDELIESLSEHLAQAFQTEEYENAINAKMNESNEKKSKLFSKLEKHAKEKTFGVKSTRMGIVTIPIVEGKPLSEKEYGELSEQAKEKIEHERNKLEPAVLDFARKVRAIELNTKEAIEELQNQIGDYIVTEVMEDLFKKYKKQKGISDHLKEIKKHILENLEEFLPNEEQDGQGDDQELTQIVPSQHHGKKGDTYLPYRVNVFVDNSEVEGAPVIVENNPTFYNLFGKIEKNIEYGIYTTDFKMIKSGSLARANGGYLVVHVVDLLRNPHVWETFKRVLKTQKLFIEDLGEQYSILPTSGLRPESIDLDVKVILIGTDWLYRLLYEHDEDFHKIFKIKADFDTQMVRSADHIEDYIKFVLTRAHVENLLPFDASGIEKIVEFSSRIVEHQEKLSTRFSLVKDITIEADFIARERKAKKISSLDVQKAIDEKYHRSSLIEDKIHEMIECGDIIIAADSKRVGEINGLAVYDLGDVAFGVPTRITCRTYSGKPGIVNIERDASLSGKIHNKGVSILTSWLNATFGSVDAPVISASLCFEQNYSGVDGDSATLAELCLILSTIAEIPINQAIAVTGSVNQMGEVQIVGGINEKVEGYFRVCEMKGLNGKQGVIIPFHNVKNLMLNEDVRKAVEKGKFHIWSASKVEDAFELLTGIKAGAWDPKEKCFTPHSAFELVNSKVHKAREEAEEKKAKEKKEKEEEKQKSKEKTKKKSEEKAKPKKKEKKTKES